MHGVDAIGMDLAYEVLVPQTTKETTPMSMKSTTTNAIIRRIDHEGAITMRGLHSLAVARAVLDQAVHAAGYSVTFDPASSADLVDYLAVTAASTIEGVAIGAGLGTLVGLIFGRPGTGAVIGAGFGIVAGAARGVERVERGWRVCAVREIDGTPSITIRALGPA